MAPTTKPTTSNRLIHAGSLSPKTFSPFGQVIQNPATHSNSPDNLTSVKANQGTATKWLDVTLLQNHYSLSPSQKPANSVVNMFVCEPRKLSTNPSDGKSIFPVTVLERHPFTPQTFVPLGVDRNDEKARYLVIVAPTLPSSSKDAAKQPPPYPTDPPRSKPCLKERLLGARPNPYTNVHVSSTTSPASTGTTPGTQRKGPGQPDLDNIQAFVARGDQAVTYGPGTWHAPMVVLGERPIDFVVVQYANGVALEDCQEVEVGGIAVDVDGVTGLRAKL